MRPRHLLPLLLLWTTTAYTACPATSAMIQQFGYTELRPPSTLLGVGSLVSITSYDPFSAKIICSAESSLGPSMRVMRSRTADARLGQMNNKKFSVDISSMLGAGGSEHMQAVQSATATLRNARIVELSDDDVLWGMRDRTPACEWAVRERVRQGFVVTMISSVLMGDLDIDVSFNQRHGHHTDVADKAMAMADLAVAFDGEVTSSLGSSIKSTGLIFAVRDDEYFAALSHAFVDESAFERDTRHLPPAIDHPGDGLVVAAPKG